MRRFTKVASLLAAMSVLVCSAAFAAPALKLPMNLFRTADVMLLSNDIKRPVSADQLLKSGDADLLKFTVRIVSADTQGIPHDMPARSLDVIVANSYGVFASGDLGLVGNSGRNALVSFDKIVVRTTTGSVPMQFALSTDVVFGGAVADNPLEFVKNVTFGLANSRDGISPDFANPCEIGCGNFKFEMTDKKFVSMDTPTAVGTITWTGTGNSEFGVECCSNFRLLVSGDNNDAALPDGRLQYAKGATLSRDFVVGRLSATPFIRVRIADENKVLVSGDKNSVFNDTVASRDFRASSWANTMFNTRGAVDVPEGKTYNMGVAYTISGDVDNCEVRSCNDCTTCDYYQKSKSVLPYVAVTNLGTESVWVLDNVQNDKVVYNADGTLKSNSSWLCNIWGGLCNFDDMMSGDKGRLGGLQIGENPNNLSHMYDFPCHIYPAFSNIWKGAGNMDFGYMARKAQNSAVITRIQGRLNVAWHGHSLSTVSLCPSCVETGFYMYWPNACAETEYEAVMKGTALAFDLTFAKSADVKLESFNQTAATGEYAAMNAVVSLDAGLVRSTDVIAGTKGNIVLNKLTWRLSAANLSDAGLLNLASDQWWRTEMWNKLAIKINGIKLDATNVQTVNALNELTAEELSFLTVVDGPQRNLGVTDTVDVSLYVFVVDSDQSAVKYYRTAQGNRFLVVYDGTLDGKFSVSGAIVKNSDTPAPVVFGVNPSTLSLNLAVSADKTKALNVVNPPAGAEVIWSVVSSDIVSLDTLSGLTVNATGLAVGTTKVTAMVSGDASKSADVTVTVKNEAPVDPVSGSSGGCNVGFAPALLLLLAPLAFLKK